MPALAILHCHGTSLLSFLVGFGCSFQGKVFSIFQSPCHAVLLLVLLFCYYFLSSDINCTVLMKSLQDASFILCRFIQLLLSEFPQRYGVFFLCKLGFQNTDFTSHGNLSVTPSIARNQVVHLCTSKVLVTLLILLINS